MNEIAEDMINIMIDIMKIIEIGIETKTETEIERQDMIDMKDMMDMMKMKEVIEINMM